MAASEQPSTASSNNDSTLLDLIPELRNNIYHIVLAPDEEQPVEITFKEIKTRTALLRTCSQIRSEATQIFYAANSFLITDVLGHRLDTAWFVKFAGVNVKLIPMITATIKLPRIFMQCLYLVFEAKPEAENALQSIAQAYRHVLDIMHDEFEACASKLVDGGIASDNIEIVKCVSDWWHVGYGNFVFASERRLTNAMTERYTKTVGLEWSEDMQGPDTVSNLLGILPISDAC